MPKSIVQVADELAAAISLPKDCRIDIQWNFDVLVISRNGKYAFAITRESIDDNTHIEAARYGLNLLLHGEMVDIQKAVNAKANVWDGTVIAQTLNPNAIG